MNALKRLFSTASQPGQQLISIDVDGNDKLGFPDVLAESESPLSLNLAEDVARHTSNDSFFAQRSIDQRILEQLKVAIVNQLQVSKGTPNSESGGHAGSCTPSEAVGRVDGSGVAVFKGPAVHGLVRFAQVNEHETRIEADFDGLTPGGLYKWAVNEYGDLREGAASTGSIYSPDPLLINSLAPKMEEAAGVLGTLIADCHGHAEFVGKSSRLEVWDLIGRSVVLYKSSDLEQASYRGVTDAIAAAVIARSLVRGTAAGGVKRLCACNGTLVWQSAGRLLSKY